MTLAEIFREEGFVKGEALGVAKGEALGVAKGEAKGKANALLETAIRLLNKKFGVLPDELQAKLGQLDPKFPTKLYLHGLLYSKSFIDRFLLLG